ncbi:hypothetical protein A3A03_03600 [Candidatus Nomurabacteria bacterium RIFCSPLOWO2_01_FULL_40_18]|uniref:Uncharacterized protein n=1 Tax=Candidatus Nomurabacteria bacterium RIFCSPLOWO2_01_FULL_40_18 TaxID=1801773 RepID=A0A1F6XKQ2_9BACT|nr:MAG: hypothetical protein A3A03_03600 [Candidatus Nomurabacteria bacterium RIFCSPLOWO2_01_FULL_40_18]
MNSAVRKRLAKAIETKLPRILTNAQARWWIKNPDCLSTVLEGLSSVVVVDDLESESIQTEKTDLKV